MRHRAVDLMSEKIVEKFPDPVQINAFFELAQKMLDAGKEPTEIKKVLKELYGASPDEIKRLDEKLFKKKADIEKESDAGTKEAVSAAMMDSLLARGYELQPGSHVLGIERWVKGDSIVSVNETPTKITVDFSKHKESSKKAGIND